MAGHSDQMSTFDKVKFKIWDSLDATEDLIRRWQPAVLPDEASYETSLYEFLLAELPGFQITRQYSQDRFRVDIAIERRVAVELKHNLATTAEYQRLVGQLVEYAAWPMSLVLVLTGTSDRDIAHRLKRDIQRHIDSWGGRSGRLVVKGALAAPKPAA